MWDIFLDASVKEAPKLVSSVVLLGLAWFVGQRLTMGWNLRQKRREYDLATAREFDALYGEFFVLLKLWNYYVRDVGAEALQGASRWNLLDRACTAEAKLESTFVRLATEKTLSKADIVRLGQFRQLYQQLRESIRDNKPLGWDWADHPDYVAFKSLAPEIAALILSDQTKPLDGVKGADALLAITSNRWEQYDVKRRTAEPGAAAAGGRDPGSS
jgi:hypothetical protein